MPVHDFMFPFVKDSRGALAGAPRILAQYLNPSAMHSMSNRDREGVMIRLR